MINMKKIILPALFCILVVFIVSCGQTGSGEAYTLKMKLAKGDKFSQEVDTKLDMNFDMMGQPMDMNMTMNGLLDFEVLGDSAGLKDVGMTYTQMKMGMKMKAMGVENITDSVMDKATSRIVGKRVLMQLNEKNEIVNTNGFEILANNEELDEATREQMNKMFSKEQMNSMLGMMFQMYPDKPVKVGDTWESETNTSMAGITMKVKGKYSLTSVKDGVAFISLEGKFSGKGNMEQGGVAMEMDMDGTQKGTVNIGLADGYLKDSDYKMEVKGAMIVMGQKMPLTMKGYYLMKGK